MAANSPIVLNTSSPDPFQSPSISPPSRAHNNGSSSIAQSSSPGLPDVSTFFNRPKVPTAGSRAQQPPEGANAGFASANSPWKAQLAKGTTEEEENKDKGNVVRPKKSAVKPAGPKKVQKAAGTVVKRKVVQARSSLQSVDDQDNSVSGHIYARSKASPGPTIQRQPANAGLAVPKDSTAALSIYDFPYEDSKPVAEAEQAEKPAKKPRKPRVNKDETLGDLATVKRPRKRAANAEKLPGELPAKKIKKRFTKSESIIVNSDEPDPVPEGESGAADTANDYPVSKLSTAVQTISLLPASKVVPSASVARIDSVHNAEPAAHVTANTTSAYFNVSGSHDTAVFTDSARPKEPSASKGLGEHSEPTVASPPAQGTAAPHPDRSTDSLGTGAQPAVPFPALIREFNYTDSRSQTTSPEKSSATQSPTKRRRIDLADASTIAPAAQSAIELPPAQPTKKTKAPRKKPQTITSLATRAYQVRDGAEEPEIPPAQADISAVRPPQAAQVISSPEKAVSAASKPKKPRKPRVKRSDGEASSKTQTKPRKTKKNKAATKEPDPAPLFLPEQARAEEKRQDPLFGTSSQLAVEESPTFIREIQAALRASEIIPPSRIATSTERDSRFKVTSAPDGMNISIRQAHRDLWNIAARDSAGQIFSRSTPPIDGNDYESTVLRETESPKLTANELHAITKSVPNASSHMNSTHRRLISASDSLEQRQVIDLLHNSPIVAPSPAQDVALPPPEADVALGNSQSKQSAKDVLDNKPVTTLPAPPSSDDSWMLLQSEDSTPKEIKTTDYSISIPIRSPIQVPVLQAPQLIRSATSPIRNRTALQPLDANMSLLAQTSPMKQPDVQQRSITDKASPSQHKRSRGRPHRDALAAEVSLKSPKRRGRPPKEATAPADVVKSRKRSPKRSKPIITPSQPTASSGWLNIDEISDSDSPSTLSPPRRKANSSPPAVRALDLAVAPSPSLKAKAPGLVTSTLKPGRADWSAISQQLYPQISDAIRSIPSSTELNNPTWHEKILLYDPIVLEDLTAWLNERGLRVEARQVKPKEKKKGRKPKDPPPEEPEEYEICSEELQPWMVQKWCEENSICCLWKEGLRGGVRTRY